MLAHIKEAVAEAELVQERWAKYVRVSDRQISVSLKSRLAEAWRAERITRGIHCCGERLCVGDIRKNEASKELIAVRK